MTASSSWRVEPLSRCVTVVTDKVEPCDAGDLPYIGLEHVEKDTGVLLGLGSPSDVKSTKTRFRAGDVLYGKLRPYLSKVLIAPTHGVCSTDMLALRARDGVSAKYIYYRLRAGDFVAYALANSKGVNLPRVSPKAVGEFPVSLPALDEQERIVARIEELMSDVDAGVADAEAARRLVGRCRQAARNHLTLGGVSRGLDHEGKPALPEGWEWSSIEGIATLVQYGTSDKADLAVTKVPVLRMGNIKDGVLVTDELKFMPDGWACGDDFRLEPGDILFTRTNGNPALVGKSAVYRGVPQNAVFASYLIRVRLDDSKAVPEFVIHCLNSAFGRAYIASVVSQVGQANVNGSKLKRFPIPLPPLDEQKRLAEKADDLLLALDAIQGDLVRSLRRAESLRQSVLKSAFSGQLVHSTEA